MTCDWVSVISGGLGPQQSYCAYAPSSIRLSNSFDNTSNWNSPCYAYEWLRLNRVDPKPDVIMYMHDDITVHSADWSDRTMKVFEEHPNCVCVGWGGATGLGHPDLYKMPYQLPMMARSGYVSNQTDWKTHGGLEKGEKQVAVIDAFFIAVRTDFLRGVGGWPYNHITHHCLDLWLACEAARAGKEVWMTGVSVTHHGGGTSTKPSYEKARWLQGGTLASDHQLPHKWLYDNYRDVLPIEVKAQ